MFRSIVELENGLNFIEQSPKNSGKLELIVCRPDVDERKELNEAVLDLHLGLVGDNWLTRGYKKTADGSAHPEMQLNIMNSRVISLISQSKSQWSLAGDQFYVDLDLSRENLPPGTQLHIGSAVVEITAVPHLGCRKFIERFGRDAALFVNSDKGKLLNLRGVNAKVVRAGKVSVGSIISKVMA